MNREQWLAERRTGIGGSDVASVFNVGHGCRRRLAYDKRGIEPNFPQETTLAMELGNLFEPWLAQKYTEKTERFVSSSASRQHPEFPEARVNPDRFIFLDQHESDVYQVTGEPGVNTGVLEIKAQGRGAYSKTKRIGLPEDYILQLQHGMWVTGTEWGSFQIGNRDSGESTHWDVTRDLTLTKELEREVPALWKVIQSDAELPDRLDVEDRRCGSCPWRQTCQGAALVHVTGESELIAAEDIRPLLQEYDERALLLGEAGALMEETKEALKLALQDRAAVRVAWGKKDRKVFFRGQDGRVSWKGEDMLKVYEALRTLRRAAYEQELGDDASGIEALRLFDVMYPLGQTFRKQGVPFRQLRIY